MKALQPLFIFMAFALAAILGTLHHELGHYLVARAQGFDAQIHYGFTSIDNSCALIAEAKMNGRSEQLFNCFMLNKAGGPAITILTGIIGIAGLLVLRRHAVVDAYRPKHLLWIILALFWSREVYMSSFCLFKYYVLGKSSRGDEPQLLLYWGIPQWLGLGVLFVISFSLCAWVCFGLVQRHRWQLFFYGIAGSLAGAALWFAWLGPLLLP